jgi:hypothetical protein
MEASVYDRPVFGPLNAGRPKELDYEHVEDYVREHAPELAPDKVWESMDTLLPTHVFTNRQHIEWAIEVERVNQQF